MTAQIIVFPRERRQVSELDERRRLVRDERRAQAHLYPRVRRLEVAPSEPRWPGGTAA